MKYVSKIIRENKRVLQFCVTLVILLVFFTYLEHNLFRNSGIHQWLIDVLGNSSVGIFNLFGFKLSYYNSEILKGNTPILLIGSTCDGLDFMTMFISFVLAYPTKYPLRKFRFIIIGIIVIHLLNSIRVVLLIWNFEFNYSTFEFNHKYTFIVILYGIVFWMWMVWAKRNAVKN